MYDVRSTIVTPWRGPPSPLAPSPLAPSPLAPSPCPLPPWGRGFFGAVMLPGGRHVAGHQLPVIFGVAVQRLEPLGPLHVEVQVVLPGEADAAVHLDGIAADLSRRLVDVGLADRRGDRRVLGAR